MAPQKEIVHLFSGGTDSTYAAASLTGIFDKINLVTYQRFGFTYTENSKINAKNLMNKYGESRITHSFINYDREFKILSFKNHLSDFFKYGFYVLINCGVCKLAMDWRTIIYCIDHNIKYVSTGAGKEMAFDPSQDIEVISGVRNLYASFGIQYFTPIFDTAYDQRDVELLKLGIIKRLGIKWSPDTWDYQPHCCQEYMNIFLIGHVCRYNPRTLKLTDERYLEFHKKMCEFHQAKREEVKRYVQEYIDHKSKNKIST